MMLISNNYSVLFEPVPQYLRLFRLLNLSDQPILCPTQFPSYFHIIGAEHGFMYLASLGPTRETFDSCHLETRSTTHRSSPVAPIFLKTVCLYVSHGWQLLLCICHSHFLSLSSIAGYFLLFHNLALFHHRAELNINV